MKHIAIIDEIQSEGFFGVSLNGRIHFRIEIVEKIYPKIIKRITDAVKSGCTIDMLAVFLTELDKRNYYYFMSMNMLTNNYLFF